MSRFREDGKASALGGVCARFMSLGLQSRDLHFELPGTVYIYSIDIRFVNATSPPIPCDAEPGGRYINSDGEGGRVPKFFYIVAVRQKSTD